MTSLTNFGQRIRDRRIEMGFTQDELAKRTGYTSRSSINKIELGIVDLPQSKISLIANVLDVTPAYLMGWDDVEEDNFTQDEIKIIHALRQNPEAKSILELIFDGSDEEIKELSNYIDFILSKRR